MKTCNVPNYCKQIYIYVYDVAHSWSQVDVYSYDVAKSCVIYQDHTQFILSVALKVAPEIPLVQTALEWVTHM